VARCLRHGEGLSLHWPFPIYNVQYYLDTQSKFSTYIQGSLRGEGGCEVPPARVIDRKRNVANISKPYQRSDTALPFAVSRANILTPVFTTQLHVVITALLKTRRLTDSLLNTTPSTRNSPVSPTCVTNSSKSTLVATSKMSARRRALTRSQQAVRSPRTGALGCRARLQSSPPPPPHRR
jgi:hypothetical protein